MKHRTADPYSDLDVIDERAPRFLQAVVGSVSLLAVATGWWPLLALLALQLAVGVTLGRRFCLPCVAYFELFQPRFGEGPLEDSRPPRFANKIGIAVLTAASVAYALGSPVVGAPLGALVAGLALLAAATGFCLGCRIYRIDARWRGIRSHRLDRIDPDDLPDAPPGADGQSVIVAFTHPLCSGCRELATRLAAEGRRVIAVDVAERPDLARKYGVAVVPTAVEIAGGGVVTSRLAG